MEYEIKDEPQGLPDRPEADRDGGLREKPQTTRKAMPATPVKSRPDRPEDAEAPIEQMGEPA